MKQKIVVKVSMHCQKCRCKALGIAAASYGVEVLRLEGEEKDQMVVIGEGVDSICLVKFLRKKVGQSYILSIAELNFRLSESANSYQTPQTLNPPQPIPPISRILANPNRLQPIPEESKSELAEIDPADESTDLNHRSNTRRSCLFTLLSFNINNHNHHPQLAQFEVVDDDGPTPRCQFTLVSFNVNMRSR